MNRKDFQEHVAGFTQSRHDLMFKIKNDAYASAQDVFGNFKRRAIEVETTPPRVILNDLSKHLDVIRQRFCFSNAAPVGESLEDRFADLSNYIDLLYALWKEASDSEASQELPPRSRAVPRYPSAAEGDSKPSFKTLPGLSGETP